MAPPPLQWDSLPTDLQQLILAHLPLSEQSRLRTINHSWLSILASSHTRDLHRRLHPRTRPSFLIYNHSVKISACTWPDVADEAAVPAPASFPLWSDFALPAPFVREWVGAGSFICIRNHLTSHAFSVGCPQSNEWKLLPNPRQPAVLSKLWAMVPHTSINAADRFYVLVLQLNSPSLHVDVYDSEKNTWTRRAVPKGAENGSVVVFSSCASRIGGLLYSIQEESRSVVTYDVQRDVWKTLEAKLPENVVFQVCKEGRFIQPIPQVIKGCKGKVLLVGTVMYTALSVGSDSDDGGITAGDVHGGTLSSAQATRMLDQNEGSHDVINYAVVWELDWSSKEWREMARAPLQMCMQMLEEATEACKTAVLPVKYSGHGELLVVMMPGSERALQFDAIEEKWAWLDLPPAAHCELSLCL